MSRMTIPPMSPTAKKRTGWTAVVLAVLGGLSQVPWAEVLAFAKGLMGVE